MNLDELISKYIDAELAPDEDSNLREFISESDKARDIFDRSVGIHLAIREDAQNIMPPKDLVRETESKVMMQIMALRAEPAPVVHKINSRVRFYQMAAAAVVMFLVGVITISDLNIINRFGFNELARLNSEEGLSRNYFIDESGSMTPLGDGIQTIEMPRERFVPIEKSTDTAPVASPAFAYSQSSELASGNSTNVPSVPAAMPPIIFENSTLAMGLRESNSTFAASSEKASNASLPVLSLHQSIMPQATNQPFSQSPQSNMQSRRGSKQISILGDLGFDIGIVHSMVNVTSHFGTDVARFGFDNAEKSSVTHFSQAISFSLDESNYLGVEMGYSQYSCKDRILVKISSGGGGSSTSSKDPSSGEIPPQYQVTPKSVSNNKQLLWCVGFWEYNFLASGDFALDTRLGLGASAEGPMGLSRVISRYELVKGLFLSVGVEGRAFRANMEELSNSKAGIKSSVSIIYGLQLKF